MKNIVIIGATSAIAQSFAELYAHQQAKLLLVGRNLQKLEIIADHLKAAGAHDVLHYVQDVGEIEDYGLFIRTLRDMLGGIDVILVAHGTLPDQKALEANTALALKEIHVNALCTIGMLNEVANLFETQQRGVICVIGSVAGDRGRKSNYIYGTAKAMLASFCEGLRHRLAPFNVQVITIKPGFVDTPMTQSFPKGFLWAKPEAIAKGIMIAIEKEKNVVYLPWFWCYIMLIIRNIPQAIFNKLNL